MKTTTATSATVLFLSIALLCGVLISAVDAARQLAPEGRVVVETHEAAAYTTLRERAWSKTTAMAWTQQLPSGPSPRGPGH
ncbi:hypothetical protein GQ55_9G429900 [Panicum hallii var. hallii]|uniref:Methyltransferase n=2 Tax=Panicum hallii TaxID=206008 RepID=A0A2T7CB04_9POAL|nr:hypothetical protein PAHAL_9G416600 [Panicum hallii]PUZ40514.1 hypothetical protein GQ55_9G429900 [Panicum hallii var. hallii]